MLNMAVNHKQAALSLVYKRVLCQCKPKNITEDVRKDLGVDISYSTARRVFECALKDIRYDHENFLLNGGHAKGARRKEFHLNKKEKKKKKSHGEERSTRNCGKCGSTGHYRKTCNNAITLHLNFERVMNGVKQGAVWLQQQVKQRYVWF